MEEERKRRKEKGKEERKGIKEMEQADGLEGEIVIKLNFEKIGKI